MKRLDRRMKRGRIWGSRYTIPAAVLISGIVSMGMFLWIDRITQTQRIDFLHKDALMDVQISAAIFHLRVDEFFAGTCRENWRNILNHFDNALKLSHALLFGGKTQHGGRLPPLEDPVFREGLEAVESRLKTIKEIALQRYEHLEAGGKGLSLEKVFDSSFSDFITTARALEILVDKSWITQNTRSRHLLNVLTFVWTASLIALSLILYKMLIDLVHNGFFGFCQLRVSNRFSRDTRLYKAIKKFSFPEAPVKAIADFR
jgi:hypothetical protein